MASAVDPVCGRELKRADAAAAIDHHGTVYFFCSEACQQQFVADPTLFADAPAAAGRRSRAASAALPLLRLGLERDRVDAVALAGRGGPVVEEVAEVAAATAAGDLGAPHPVRAVGLGGDGLRVGRRGEAGPAGPGVELGVRRKQLGAAAGAEIGGVVVGVPVGAREGPLGPLARAAPRTASRRQRRRATRRRSSPLFVVASSPEDAMRGSISCYAAAALAIRPRPRHRHRPRPHRRHRHADRHPVAAGRDAARHRAGRRAGAAHALPAGRRPRDARRAQGAAVRGQAAGHGARLQAGRADRRRRAPAPTARGAATSSPRSGRRWARRTCTPSPRRWPPRAPTSRRSAACRRTRWRRSRSTRCCRPTATATRSSARCCTWRPAPGFDVSLQRESLYRRSKRLVVLDMDSTLIRIEVIDELARAAGVGPEVSRITERAMQGEMDYDESLRQRVGAAGGPRRRGARPASPPTCRSPTAPRR